MAYYCRQRDLNEVKYVLRDQAQQITCLTNMIAGSAQGHPITRGDVQTSRNGSLCAPECDCQKNCGYFGNHPNDKQAAMQLKLRAAGTLLYKLINESRQLEAARQVLLQQNQDLNARIEVLEKMALLSKSSASFQQSDFLSSTLPPVQSQRASSSDNVWDLLLTN